MIIRFVIKNLYSFKEETEFNLFPNKTQRLVHHKVSHGDIDFLRLSAVYGANGSGKSNLIKAISLMENMVEKGKLVADTSDLKFKLTEECSQLPISMAIEFFANGKIYYYSITFDKGIILNEYLAESTKDRDILIFDRNVINNKQGIAFYHGYASDEKNKLFVDVLAEKLIQKDELLISFLHSKYKEEFPQISIAYQWFDTTLVVIMPDARPGGIAHILDTNEELYSFANSLFPTLNTGIDSLDIQKQEIDKSSNIPDGPHLKDISDRLKQNPNVFSIMRDSETGEEISLVYENEKLWTKRLIPYHLNDKGKKVDFNLPMESDGTKRLIDYIPALNGIINENRVYLIDEIERSIHPITIKEIITKISLDEKAKGQLIFTTHESCLLDQEILRPDEIWFAQKDIDGSSKLYSLSDFNIHNTANIENGYLNGRYGGIPFLSNLQDLNWHKYELSEQEESL